MHPVPAFLATAALLSLTGLTGCATRQSVSAPIPASLSADATFIDLQPEWRIRVIFPILQSGGYLLKTPPGTSPQTTSPPSTGTTITLEAGADFLGYETDYYRISRRLRRGTAIRFESAAITRDGQTRAQPASLHSLFASARRFRYTRLLYLQRSSTADHEMAVLTANQPQQLATLTRQIQTNPASCTTSPETSCEWVPRGISVLPEKREVSAHNIAWVPAS